MYINWQLESHYHIQYTDYVLLDDVMQIIQIARRIQFTNIEHRNEIHNWLLNINRFKIEKGYRAPKMPFTNCTNSDFADLVDDIVYALEYSEVDMYWDSIKHMYNLINADLSILWTDGIFTQKSYERQMVLEWSNDEEVTYS